jgi:DUF1016 N-terminal domain
MDSLNSSLVMLYGKVRRRTRKEILKEKRAKYGEEIVATVSRQLSGKFSPGFAENRLKRMIQFV